MATNAGVVKGYSVGLALIALGVAAHMLFGAGQSEYPFLTFYIPITLTAMLAGFGPALLGAAISSMVAWYFFIPPVFSFALSPGNAAALILFFTSGILIAYGVSRSAPGPRSAFVDEYTHYRRHS
jgi:K+-sensing histidine kinase KdpD